MNDPIVRSIMEMPVSKTVSSNQHEFIDAICCLNVNTNAIRLFVYTGCSHLDFSFFYRVPAWHPGIDMQSGAQCAPTACGRVVTETADSVVGLENVFTVLFQFTELWPTFADSTSTRVRSSS